MHYLHTRKPPVIHGDLRSPNLLLDLTIDDNRPRYHVKIADFGLARMMNQNSNMVSGAEHVIKAKRAAAGSLARWGHMQLWLHAEPKQPHGEW